MPKTQSKPRTRIRTATAAERRTHEKWVREITVIPTAAGREQRVIAWIRRWVDARRDLRWRQDRAGNVLITRAARRTNRPIYLTAHLDHPAFVVRRMLDPRTVELEFRGGVQDAYFEAARVEIFDAGDAVHRGVITKLDPKARPFKRATVRLTRRAGSIQAGDVGRWSFRGALPRVTKGSLHTYACDDLAAVAAALSTLDVLRKTPDGPDVGVLLTRAEEVGFIGTLAACKAGTVPRSARLICLENSRSFSDSPIGGGPILRVGDKISVFSPALTNRIGALLTDHQSRHPGFRWQRKLMPGGSCEATAFSTFGYDSTCICLPLGNYHNMADIDAVAAGRRPARVGPEFIALEDYHGMIEMLTVCVERLDSDRLPTMEGRMERLLAEHGHVLSE